MEKQTYLQQARAILASYRVKLEELKAIALQAEGRQRMMYHLRIGELQSRLNALQSGMQDLEQRGDESWRMLQRSVENASREFGAQLARMMVL